MQINQITIPFIILIGLLYANNDNRRNRLSYILLCSCVLLLVAALRSPEWMTNTYGIDTLNYKGYFEDTFDMGWNEFRQSFYMRYLMKDDEFEMGFVALNKIISLLTHEFWLYSLIADLLFFVPFGIILYRYTTSTRQIMFAFVFYVALVQVFLLGGSRQMFSLGFDLMALLALLDSKRILSIVLFLIGVTIHLSSFLFIVPLLMIWYGVKPATLKFLHAICFIVFPVVLLFPNEMIVFMGNTMGIEKYAAYGKNAIQGGSENFIFLIETLSFFFLLAISRKALLANQKIRNFYVMAPLLTFFAPLIISNGSMIRISLYYHLFIALLVPYAIDCAFGKKNSGIVYAGVIGVLALLTLSGGGITYYFFWQR